MRAKFRVQRVEEFHSTDGTQHSERVVLSPVFKEDDPSAENSRFWSATPAGQVDLYISNPSAFGLLKNGKAFYLDFTPAD